MKSYLEALDGLYPDSQEGDSNFDRLEPKIYNGRLRLKSLRLDTSHFPLIPGIKMTKDIRRKRKQSKRTTIVLYIDSNPSEAIKNDFYFIFCIVFAKKEGS